MAAFKVLGGRLTLFDGPKGYRPAEDSFWLAALAPATNGCVCDLGCGTGAVGLAYLMTHSAPNLLDPKLVAPNLVGFDVQADMTSAAHQAAIYNNLKGAFIIGDMAALPFTPETFALTLANPPFYNPQREMRATKPAHQPIKFTNTPLKNWLTAMANLTIPQGQMAIVVSAQDSHALIKHAATLACTLTDLFFLKTHPNKAPKRAVLIFRKGTHTGAENAVKEQVIDTYKASMREKYLAEH